LATVIGTAAVQLPAVWLLSAATVALFGIAPRFMPVAWGVLVGFIALCLIGSLAGFPQWLLDLEPFAHIVRVGSGFTAVPLLWLPAIDAALIAVGVMAFRRHDVRCQGAGGMKTDLRAWSSALIGLVVPGVLLFWPAGTFNYWQAWVFIAVFSLATLVQFMYLGRTDPAALQRRMHRGARAETRAVQKIISICAFLGSNAMLVFSAFDHRFGWSPVPTAVSLLGDLLIVIGIGLSLLVVAQNTYAATTVRIEADQTLASRRLYGLVRHPMYAATVILILGIPLALGSYWALVFIVPGVALLVVRILDEEKVLTQELSEYREYTQQVRYRLMPYVW
jgi:protein-S-isoprenylcysteine O-methyltransferase Ste14